MPTARRRGSALGAIDRHIGRRLAQCRAQRGLAAADLDALLGARQGTVARIESGRRAPHAFDLVVLCRALGIPIGELFEGAPEPTPGSRPGAVASDMERIDEGARFVAAFHRITDRAMRRELLALIKAVARAES